MALVLGEVTAQGQPVLEPLAPTYLAPLAGAIAATGAVLPRLVEAFRSGAGVPYGDYPGGHLIQAAFNRPAFTSDLVSQWLPAIPDVAARLADANRPAHVGDLGCGAGWSAIALATAYPHITVEGVDNDQPSIELAQRNAAEARVTRRVSFTVADLGALKADGGARYDVEFLFECLHDLPRPVEALVNARRWLRPDQPVVVPAAGTRRPGPRAGRHPAAPGHAGRAGPACRLRRGHRAGHRAPVLAVLPPAP